MQTTYSELAGLLIDVECSLRSLRLWSERQPSAEALSSNEPFACDTLLFTEWLQFIFLPRLYQMIEREAQLPAVCAVAPMAEEYFRGSLINAGELINQLEQIDVLVTNSD